MTVYHSVKDAKKAAKKMGIKGAKIVPFALGNKVAYQIVDPKRFT